MLVVDVDVEGCRVKTSYESLILQDEVGFGPKSFWALKSRSRTGAPLHAVAVRKMATTSSAIF